MYNRIEKKWGGDIKMNYKEKYNTWINSDIIDEVTKNELKGISEDKEIEDRFYKDLDFASLIHNQCSKVLDCTYSNLLLNKLNQKSQADGKDLRRPSQNS